MAEREPVTRTEIVQYIEEAFGSHAVARGDLIDHARSAGARPDLVTLLQRLPNDRPYTHVRDLWRHLDEVPV